MQPNNVNRRLRWRAPSTRPAQSRIREFVLPNGQMGWVFR